jgi:hypothetical protein
VPLLQTIYPAKDQAPFTTVRHCQLSHLPKGRLSARGVTVVPRYCTVSVTGGVLCTSDPVVYVPVTVMV